MEVLSGIRYLEFGEVIVGPWSGQISALFGAEVIKVESGFRLDLQRRSVRLPDGSSAGLPYIPGQPIPQGLITDTPGSNWVNLNKKGIRLNLAEVEAVDLAKRLISISDVLVENYRPGVMDRLGLGYSAARELKPDIVYASASAVGYASSGLEARQLGYGALFSALGGLAHLSGYPDGPPAEGFGRQDVVNGTILALSVMLAMVHRQRTGQGQHIDFSAREGASYLLGDSFMEVALNDRDPYREGNGDDVMAPHNCYRCRDRDGLDHWVSIVIGVEEEWRAFCVAIGSPDWIRDARFNDGYSRWQNQEELDKLIEAWTINYTDYQVMETLQQAGVAAAPSYSTDQIWGDRHLEDRGVFQIVEHPALGALSVIKSPCRLSLTPPEIKTHGTMLGEYNGYIFGDLLGLSQQKIANLVEKRVIY